MTYAEHCPDGEPHRWCASNHTTGLHCSRCNAARQPGQPDFPWTRPMTIEETMRLQRALAIDHGRLQERRRVRKMVEQLGAGARILCAKEGMDVGAYFEIWSQGFLRCRSMLLDMLDTAEPDKE
jgi:hypothetical protein